MSFAKKRINFHTFLRRAKNLHSDIFIGSRQFWKSSKKLFSTTVHIFDSRNKNYNLKNEIFSSFFFSKNSWSKYNWICFKRGDFFNDNKPISTSIFKHKKSYQVQEFSKYLTSKIIHFAKIKVYSTWRLESKKGTNCSWKKKEEKKEAMLFLAVKIVFFFFGSFVEKK